MRACTMASGGVMFIPDEIERQTEKQKRAASPVKYQDLLQQEEQSPLGVEQKKPLTQRIWNKLKRAA